jgi:DNA primase
MMQHHNKKATRYANTETAHSQNLNSNYFKNSLTPLDFYSHELPNAPLKKHGWNDGGLCPFHADNKPGSFRVNLTTGAFKCFACGTNGGDIIAFAMALNGLNFIDALAKLADEWGIV